ncbi:LysR family transcriptional regulator [Burkholderia ubonensis]|uniref:LysR family transcriptional regulator n=1 Tax=Burkholderia ubonensis TaxID=101571 RepID=UPI00075294B6|nr:LysR family transcriptional regulator [Burkholderia ubonensis]KVD36516.1 LysR family transcriptional regulator [Burkholderia ubonensis]KWB39207.1 LysR family transcriptional regulator [Burkholderia ubonensis]KWK81584.1 LysR family transcriptional regulator [Burkholderia ubonensis]OJA54875.1 LysR family transcriptional regulator [Burkholderia ubonensis]
MDLLAAMRIFVRVVERGNLSRAAKDLGLGQPTVSDRVERLERFLGVRLLLRSTRAVSCTDEGILFYQRSKIVLDAADEARAVVTLGNKIVRGRIRIAAPHGLGEVVLPEILTVIREHNPQLYIDLILNDEITDPVTEGVDISLRLGPISDGNFVARRMGHVRRVLVASPSYIEKHGLPEEPTDIVGHPFIRVTGLFNDGQLRLMSPSKSVRPTPINIVISTSHWRPVYELLLNGAGIGVLQEHVCVDALASGRLVRLLPDYTVPGFDLHALLPVTRPVPSKTQVVVKILEEYLPKAMARAADQATLDA